VLSAQARPLRGVRLRPPAADVQGTAQLNAADLPTPETRLELLGLTIEKLIAVGLRVHRHGSLRLPKDELVVAQENGTLHRNFQGYSTRGYCDLIGLGVSSIGRSATTTCRTSRRCRSTTARWTGARTPSYAEERDSGRNRPVTAPQHPANSKRGRRRCRPRRRASVVPEEQGGRNRDGCRVQRPHQGGPPGTQPHQGQEEERVADRYARIPLNPRNTMERAEIGSGSRNGRTAPEADRPEHRLGEIHAERESRSLHPAPEDRPSAHEHAESREIPQ